MKKKPSRKASAVSTLPRKKSPVAGILAQSTRKPSSIQGERAAISQCVKGFESIGRKRIPFVLDTYPGRGNPGDYIVTTYGTHDATAHVNGITLLVKHERRGGATWSTVAAGDVLQKGEATRILKQGGILNTTAGNNLFHAVQLARRFPENETAREIIYGYILQDIAAEKLENCKVLAKCIKAAPKREKETKREKILAALLVLAGKKNRIPTREELFQKWINGEKDATDARNFEKELKGMGLGWLPV